MTINELVHILLKETEHDNRTPRVLQVMREKIDPEIGRMSEQELRDELSNAVFALYQRGCMEYALEDNLEYFKDEATSWNDVAGLLQEELKEEPRRRARIAGSADKKDKSEALELWICWGKNPGMFKNKSAFCKKLTENIPGKNYPYCSHNTSRGWFKYFRENYPQPSIENLLPKK